MTLNFVMLDLIDARVRAATDRHTAMGTMSERTSATRAMVTFDGSSVAVPVKMFSDVLAMQGDRVGLIRIGTDWVVVGAFSAVEIGTYIDYTDTFGIQGTGSNPTKGTSTYFAEYMWINRSRIRIRVRVNFLTGWVQGTGTFLVSLPLAASASSIAAEVGQWWLNDSGVAVRGGTCVCQSSTTLTLFAADNNAQMAFGGTPFDSADNLIVNFEYEPVV